MNLPQNGKARLALVGAVGGIVSILTGAWGLYYGWSANVEAAVVQQRLVNAHDETLQRIIPKVEDCHEVNEIQKVQIGEHDRALTRLEKSLERTNDLVQLYLQSQMRRGEVPR